MANINNHIHFLLNLGEASVTTRQAILTNLTQTQLNVIVSMIDRIIDGTVSPLRRDVPLFERKRRLFRTLTSTHVSFSRKKILLRRYHTLIPRLLRVLYLIQVVLHEQRAVEE